MLLALDTPDKAAKGKLRAEHKLTSCNPLSPGGLRVSFLRPKNKGKGKTDNSQMTANSLHQSEMVLMI